MGSMAAGMHAHRTVSGVVAAVVISSLLLVAEAAPQLGGGKNGAVAQKAGATSKCIVYQPKTCWFALQADPAKQPIHFPRCAFVDCKFDVAKELVCPFAAGGAFVETERQDCPDFMKVAKRKLPGCGKACCGGVVPGKFVTEKADPAAMHYRAAKGVGCQYVNYRRHEVLDKLLGEDIDILVAGDSMMRQLYTRLVQLLRGRRRVFDYRVHTHASYAYCDEADTFRTASYLANMKQPEKKYLLDVIPEFFARDQDRLGPKQCTRGVGRIDFLHAPLFATHGDALEAYVKQADPKRKLVILSYVGVWTKVHQIPAKYFRALERVLKRPGGAVILTLSVPTLKEVRAPGRAAKYRVRTAQLRRWAEQRSPAAGFIDFDSLSLAPNGPPNTKSDKHWSCYTTWPQESRGGAAMAKLRREMLGVNSFRERLYDNPVGHIWMTTDGECYDEMNRAVWVVALNAIMQTTAGASGNFSFAPGAFDKLAPPVYEADEAMAGSAQETAVLKAVNKILAGQAAKKKPGGAAKASDFSAAAAASAAGGAAGAVPSIPSRAAAAGALTGDKPGAGSAPGAASGTQRQSAAIASVGRTSGGGGGAGGSVGSPAKGAKPKQVKNVVDATVGAAANRARGGSGGSAASPAKPAPAKQVKKVVDATAGAAATKALGGSWGSSGSPAKAAPAKQVEKNATAGAAAAKALGGSGGSSGGPAKAAPAKQADPTARQSAKTMSGGDAGGKPSADPDTRTSSSAATKAAATAAGDLGSSSLQSAVRAGGAAAGGAAAAAAAGKDWLQAEMQQALGGDVSKGGSAGGAAGGGGNDGPVSSRQAGTPAAKEPAGKVSQGASLGGAAGGRGSAAGAAAGDADAASGMADSDAAAGVDTEEEAEMQDARVDTRIWQPRARSAGGVAGGGGTGGRAAGVSGAAGGGSEEAESTPDSSAANLESSVARSGNGAGRGGGSGEAEAAPDSGAAAAGAGAARGASARASGVLTSSAEVAAGGTRHADKPQSAHSMGTASGEDELSSLILEADADSEDDAVQGGGDEEATADAGKAGSSKSAGSAAVMPEDETLDVDSETAPLIDEEA